jgi:hypothetical protein
MFWLRTSQTTIFKTGGVLFPIAAHLIGVKAGFLAENFATAASSCFGLDMNLPVYHQEKDGSTPCKFIVCHSNGRWAKNLEVSRAKMQTADDANHDWGLGLPCLSNFFAETN